MASLETRRTFEARSFIRELSRLSASSPNRGWKYLILMYTYQIIFLHLNFNEKQVREPAH